jgi:GxxExxY protein
LNHRGTKEEEEVNKREFDELSGRVIGYAIEVHRSLGPGLLESAYDACLCHELTQGRVDYQRQVPLPVLYKGIELDCAYRLDSIVERRLIIEIKAVEKLLPIHTAQLLTYLKLSGIKVGLLMNFNAEALRAGIKRVSL